MKWRLSHSQDPIALAIVDGLGLFHEHGPHYSRRTPGSKSFTGCGQEIVLITDDENDVWACVYAKIPYARGANANCDRRLWRNMLFRNLSLSLSSELIVSATKETYLQWLLRYGRLPAERLRTEIKINAVRSKNPGYCYQCAGWEKAPITRRGMLYLYAPERAQVWDAVGKAAA